MEKLEKWVRTGVALLIYVVTLVIAGSRVQSDVKYLREDMTLLQRTVSKDVDKLTTAIQQLTRSFDREGTQRSEKIAALEDAIERLERRIESLEAAVRRANGG